MISPAALKSAIGNRLDVATDSMRQFSRRWDVAGVSITPANSISTSRRRIPNPGCPKGGVLVPDKAMRAWSASNPKGYKALFLERAKIMPQMRGSAKVWWRRTAPALTSNRIRSRWVSRAYCARTVQLSKRHRDIHFQDLDPSLAPISVIITTLAARAHEFCALNAVYDSELDLLCDVVRNMPRFIEVDETGGRRRWFIWNETTEHENFAEKWNSDPRRAVSFYDWHRKLLGDIVSLTHIEGLDVLTKRLGSAFGSTPANRALDGLVEPVSAARRAGTLPRGAGRWFDCGARCVFDAGAGEHLSWKR